jgi:hypothetical protein
MPTDSKKRKQTDESDAESSAPPSDTLAAFDVVVPDSVRDFFLTTEVMGNGGFQSLCRMLSARLQTTSVLRLDAAEFKRIVRYANHYGEGGFQSRLRRLASEWIEQNFNRLPR